MKKKNLIVFDIDDTLTKSEEQHQTAYVQTMQEFGITNINQNWKAYTHHTDSYILKENYEANFSKSFAIKWIPEFEAVMTQKLLQLPKTTAIAGARTIIPYFIEKTDYAVCFATGSLLEPAFIKLTQAGIPFVPQVVVGSNGVFEREGIVSEAIEKAKIYFQVTDFEQIISVGDGLWDLKTAKNLGLHFVGIGNKNKSDFDAAGIQSFLLDWTHFNFEKIQQELGIL